MFLDFYFLNDAGHACDDIHLMDRLDHNLEAPCMSHTALKILLDSDVWYFYWVNLFVIVVI